MIYAVLALTPIILVILLLLYFKRPLYITAPIAFLYTLLITLFIWKQTTLAAIGAIGKALFVAIDISLIIFGAIFFLEFLKETGIIHSLERYFGAISQDKRIQVILLVWFFGSFIEGTAGFGTPAAIVAPLLVGIGFPAVLAVVLALIGNSTAVVFGAVGTPIRVGLAGLDITNVASYAAGINLVAGILVPIMLVFVMVKYLKKPFSDFYEMLPFAIWAGVCFTVPYFLASFLGQEFPSLIGPFVGLLILALTTRAGFLVPKNIWSFKRAKKYVHFSAWYSFFPYILLVVLLLLGKYVLPSFVVPLTGGISHSINLFNPGLLFLATIFISAILFKISRHALAHLASIAGKILLKPFIAILGVVAFVQLMIHSGTNTSGIPGMISSLAQFITHPSLPFVAPFIGIFGAFISGSATVSTLLFGNFQATAALSIGVSVGVILALQIVGAGVGNMIALQNIVAAQATVQLNGRESEILKYTVLPCIIYGFVVGLIGLLLVYVFRL